MTQELKIAVFYYEGFAGFEITLTLLLLNEHEITFIALEDKPYESSERQRFLIDKTLSATDPLEVDLLIIPGGDSSPIYESKALKDFISRVLDNGKTVAGICGGSELLAAMGFLDGKKCTGNTSGITELDLVYPYYKKTLLSDEYVVVDGNLITAQGQAFIEFAVTVAKHMGVIKDEAEKIESLNWFKNIRGE